MKKLSLILSLVGLVAATTVQAAFDGTITLNGGPYQNGNGGEFTATTTTSPGSPILGNFQTFCIEDNEFISLPGGPYNYRINTGAVAGGNSGQTTTDPYTGKPMDNISVGTAWLYSQFAKGTLVDNGAVSYFAGDRHANAGVLQNAIWGLEGEVAYDPNNTYIEEAKSVLGLNDTQLQADATPYEYGVVALNLYNQDGSLAQDQLGIVPEPTTMVAGALLLLPFGASTIRILRKRQAA